MLPGLFMKSLYAIDNIPIAWKINPRRKQTLDVASALAVAMAPWYADWSQTILGTEPSLDQISNVWMKDLMRTMPERYQKFFELKEIAKAKILIPGKDRAIKRAEALGKLDCSWLGCSTPPKGPFEKSDAHRCSVCMEVRYCCAACQKADWPGHKKACKLIKERRNS